MSWRHDEYSFLWLLAGLAAFLASSIIYELTQKIRSRKPVYLKKAKPLDGLLRERPARHRDYPFFKPDPRPPPKLPLRLNLNLRSRGSAKIAALAAIVAFAVVWGLGSSPWPVMTTLRHIASAPNCGFARLVGLAPARRGEPGYWKRHDRDGDGIACEPWPPRVSNRF
jgi:hypothetical protein